MKTKTLAQILADLNEIYSGPTQDHGDHIFTAIHEIDEAISAEKFSDAEDDYEESCNQHRLTASDLGIDVRRA